VPVAIALSTELSAESSSGDVPPRDGSSPERADASKAAAPAGKRNREAKGGRCV